MAIANASIEHRSVNVEKSADHRDDVWPALVNVFQEQGYDAGYSRGVNDTLAGILEATEAFLHKQPNASAQTRADLYAFSQFLEEFLPKRSSASHEGFVGGLGI